MPPNPPNFGFGVTGTGSMGENAPNAEEGPDVGGGDVKPPPPKAEDPELDPNADEPPKVEEEVPEPPEPPKAEEEVPEPPEPPNAEAPKPPDEEVPENTEPPKAEEGAAEPPKLPEEPPKAEA